MSRQFKDYILCAPDRTDERKACIDDLDRMCAEMLENPSPSKTWLDDANSYKAWVSRLDVLEYHVIKDIRTPILIVHGDKDRDSVPIESARELIRMLSEDSEVDFEYSEVPGAEHAIGIGIEGQSNLVRLAMFNWLFDRPIGHGGPPTLGRPTED